MSKILFLLNNHFTHDSRVLKEGRSLVNAGYDVTIRCFHDDGLEKYQEIEGIRVERVIYTSRSSAKSVVHKIYILLKYFLCCLKDSKKFDYIHCHDLSTLPIGVLVKWMNMRGQKIVYDCHEYETEVYRPQKWTKPLMQVVERLFVHHADKYITVSQSIAQEYKKNYGLEKIYLVLNCPNYQEISERDLFREKFNISKDKMIFLYQGGLGRGRGIEIILESFKALKDPQKVIVFMGSGILEKEVKEAAELHDNIFYHEAVGLDVLLNYTSSADIGILFYQNTCLNHYYCSPNKLFEYTMAELPMISSNLYELKRILTKYQNGYIAENNNADGFSKAIDGANMSDIKKMKEKTIEMKKIYNWEEQEKVLIQLYEDLSAEMKGKS